MPKVWKSCFTFTDCLKIYLSRKTSCVRKDFRRHWILLGPSVYCLFLVWFGWCFFSPDRIGCTDRKNTWKAAIAREQWSWFGCNPGQVLKGTSQGFVYLIFISTFLYFVFVYFCICLFVYFCICIWPHRRVVEGTAPSVLPKVPYHLAPCNSVLSCEERYKIYF